MERRNVVAIRVMARRNVAVVNSMTGLYAKEIYCTEPYFTYLATDHRVRNAADLLITSEGERDS
jgi:hypothetical protein